MATELTIGKAGRLVIPKPVRERLGLRAGSKVKMTEHQRAVTFEPLESEPSLKRKKGILVHTGKAPPGFDVVRAIEEDREERIRHILGRE